MEKRSSQKRALIHSGDDCFQSKKVKEDDDPEQPISSSKSYSNSYQASQLMPADTNSSSLLSGCNFIGEQSSKYANVDQQSTSSSTSSSSSSAYSSNSLTNELFLSNQIPVSAASVSGPLSQPLSSVGSRGKPMSNNDEIDEIIKNKEIELTKVRSDIDTLLEERRLLQSKKKMTIKESNRLQIINDDDLPVKKKREENLQREIEKYVSNRHELQIIKTKDVSLPGNNLPSPILSYTILSYILSIYLYTIPCYFILTFCYSILSICLYR
jgi:hypothetical protein